MSKYYGVSVEFVNFEGTVERILSVPPQQVPSIFLKQENRLGYAWEDKETLRNPFMSQYKWDIDSKILEITGYYPNPKFKIKMIEIDSEELTINRLKYGF